MNATTLNQRLESFYTNHISELSSLMHTFEGASCPHFLSVPDGYPACPIRLLIVGQQTYGWGDPKVFQCPRILQSLIQLYADFNLGHNYNASPFWQASMTLQRLLNPSCPERNFIWSNLVKIDQNRKRPNRELEEKVCSLNILQSELSITRPDVVVFFTGPYYDERLKSTFSGINFVPVSKMVATLIHPELPDLAFRTYHPNYLRRSGNWRVLEKIAELVLSARTAVNSEKQ